MRKVNIFHPALANTLQLTMEGTSGEVRHGGSFSTFIDDNGEDEIENIASSWLEYQSNIGMTATEWNKATYAEPVWNNKFTPEERIEVLYKGDFIITEI